MTLIITTLDSDNKRTLYADKRASGDGIIGFNNFNKIITNGKVFISGAGMASDYVLHELVLDKITAKKPRLSDIFFAYKEAALMLYPTENEQFSHFDSQAIITFKGQNLAFDIAIEENQLAVSEITEEVFYSIGSGANAAQALYYYDKNIEISKIYETLGKYDITVSPEYKSFKM